MKRIRARTLMHNRVPHTSIEGKIEWLRKKGCQFPITRTELHTTYGHGFGDGMIREMARRGMLVLGEAWDGSLPRGACYGLEDNGITSRADFREKYLAGELEKMMGWRGFGKVMVQRVLVWAGLPVPDDGRRKVCMTLDINTFGAMDALIKQRGLRSREELVTRLVMEASKAGDQKTG
ncbi:MAG: hypothetical protein HZC54_19850 [Verrucomicrobia bacterium]|nr:hypothetical protein [Verrucomicrobiota bacterium]